MDALLAALVLSLVANVALYCRMSEWRERYRRLMDSICPGLE